MLHSGVSSPTTGRMPCLRRGRRRYRFLASAAAASAASAIKSINTSNCRIRGGKGRSMPQAIGNATLLSLQLLPQFRTTEALIRCHSADDTGPGWVEGSVIGGMTLGWGGRHVICSVGGMRVCFFWRVMVVAAAVGVWGPFASARAEGTLFRGATLFTLVDGETVARNDGFLFVSEEGTIEALGAGDPLADPVVEGTVGRGNQDR
jgi:hypothetical protein